MCALNEKTLAWAYHDAVLFARCVVALPQIGRGALALDLPSAEVLLLLLGLGHLLPQSGALVAHITAQQTGHFR